MVSLITSIIFVISVGYGVRGVYHLYVFWRKKDRARLTAARDCLIGFVCSHAVILVLLSHSRYSGLVSGSYILFLAKIAVFNRVKKRPFSEHVAVPLWIILTVTVLGLVLGVLGLVWEVLTVVMSKIAEYFAWR